MTRLLFALYFIETGLVLVVGPWTAWWDRNFFAAVVPWLGIVMASRMSRVAFGLAGIITLAAGVVEVWNLLFGEVPRERAAGNRQQSM